MTQLNAIDEIKAFIEEFDAILEHSYVDDKEVYVRVARGYDYADLSVDKPAMIIRFLNHNFKRSMVSGHLGSHLCEIEIIGTQPYNVGLEWNYPQYDEFSCERISVERESYSVQDIQQKFDRLLNEYNERIETESAYRQKIESALGFIERETVSLEKKVLFYGENSPKGEAEAKAIKLLQKIKNCLAE
jgi:hypothetical protein